MSILAWVGLGLAAGGLARIILRGREDGDLLILAYLGIGGALVGGTAGAAAGLGDPLTRFVDLSTWAAATLGSVSLLLLWQALRDDL